MGDLVLETKRLVLRKTDESDAALQHRVLNSPVLMEHLGGPKELHEIETKHARTMALQAQEGFGFLMLIEKASGELVGTAGIKRVDNTHAPNQGDHEVGWIIREDRWRMGLAQEAMTAILDWAFGRVGAPYVVALTSEANIGSWRLMEKLGMVRREDLDFVDPGFPDKDNPVIQYSLTQAEWEAQK